MSNGQHVIIIDDDKFNNLVCTKYIEMVGDYQADVLAFTDPERGMQHLRELGTHTPCEHTILLLDLNMPVMTGWELLEEFETLGDQCKAAFTVFVVSSSLDPIDHRRASMNPRIVDFIVKPINRSIITRILDTNTLAS